MIEVLFGESEAASMRIAKSHAEGGKAKCQPAGLFSGKKDASHKSSPTEWAKGLPEEVVCLDFSMDIGDLSVPLDSPRRREIIASMHSVDMPANQRPQPSKSQPVDASIEEWGRLQKFLEEGREARIWYSDAPYSRCGFYHLCQLLRKYNNAYYVVKLPEHVVQGKCVIAYQGWGEVSQEEFSSFLPYAKELSKEEIRMYCSLWTELEEENSPLRAVVNGRVTGVSEDFYDFQIWKRLTREPIKEARLIGDMIGHEQFGVGDHWYAKRIEHHIRQGRICVAEDCEIPYGRMICLAEDGQESQ